MAFALTWGARANSLGPVKQQRFTYTCTAADTSITVTPPSFGDRLDYILIDGIARTSADSISGTTGTVTCQVLGMALYSFVISSGSATVGAVYADTGGNSFSIAATVASQVAVTAKSATPPAAASGTLTKISGTGDATLTFSAYTAPTITGTGVAYGV